MERLRGAGNMQKLPKQKKCRSCREPFTPFRPLQIACSHGCAISLATAKREKEERKTAQVARKEHREALDKLKSRGYYVQQAQNAVNAFIRARDKNAGYPCISCLKHKSGYDAGHYLARSTHPELRFDEDNIHAQCYYCNNYNKNAHSAYRANLIARIGIERVEALEAAHPPAKWTIDELKVIRDEYRLKTKIVIDNLK